MNAAIVQRLDHRCLVDHLTTSDIDDMVVALLAALITRSVPGRCLRRLDAEQRRQAVASSAAQSFVGVSGPEPLR